MPQFYALLHPIEDKRLTRIAYYLEDVYKLFTAARRKTFDIWMAGREVTVHNDKGIIYKEQLDEFFESLFV